MKKLVVTLMCALGAFAASAVINPVWAQNNSKEAAEAARKHRAEKANPSKAAPAAPAAAAQPAPAKPAAGGNSVAARLQACKTEAGSNFIKREQCVWTLCKGHWGQGGCPAERTDASQNR
jgi:predicted lipid-binding transport protein (Tim44 family)